MGHHRERKQLIYSREANSLDCAFNAVDPIVEFAVKCAVCDANDPGGDGRIQLNQGNNVIEGAQGVVITECSLGRTAALEPMSPVALRISSMIWEFGAVVMSWTMV